MWVVGTLIGWVGLCLVLASIENPFREVKAGARGSYKLLAFGAESMLFAVPFGTWFRQMTKMVCASSVSCLIRTSAFGSCLAIHWGTCRQRMKTALTPNRK
jgi:hypothetical protein